MNAIDIIKRDHRAVELDYKKFKGAKDAADRDAIALQILDALDQHARMEEELFYPVVKDEGNEKASSMIDESFAEHATMKEQVAMIRSEIQEEGLGMKIDSLMAGVMHHVKEEENFLLPAVQESISKERLEELADEMDAWSPTAGVTLKDEVRERAGVEQDILLG